ncbi:OsmC family protein [Methylobacterium oryzisoli]|uniref:OsmC family protein n=1 Tax=Methylobacterium oryzisoli TaxID=3385502 RepID=UPI003891A954
MTVQLDVSLRHLQNYQFLIDFGETLPQLFVDEPDPIGAGEGPCPEQMLAACVANCLCGSLVFALRKYRQPTAGLAAKASCHVERNEAGRLRVSAIDVAIVLDLASVEADRLDKVLAQFRKFCTVSESVEAGVPVRVTVRDTTGTRLPEPDTVEPHRSTAGQPTQERRDA